jgi:hypothetical protein
VISSHVGVCTWPTPPPDKAPRAPSPAPRLASKPHAMISDRFARPPLSLPPSPSLAAAAPACSLSSGRGAQTAPICPSFLPALVPAAAPALRRLRPFCRARYIAPRHPPSPALADSPRRPSQLLTHSIAAFGTFCQRTRRPICLFHNTPPPPPRPRVQVGQPSPHRGRAAPRQQANSAPAHPRARRAPAAAAALARSSRPHSSE